MTQNDASQYEPGVVATIAFALVFGWTVLARPPDFSGWSARQLAIAVVSIVFWGFVIHGIWTVVFA